MGTDGFVESQRKEASSSTASTYTFEHQNTTALKPTRIQKRRPQPSYVAAPAVHETLCAARAENTDMKKSRKNTDV